MFENFRQLYVVLKYALKPHLDVTLYCGLGNRDCSCVLIYSTEKTRVDVQIATRC